VWAALGLVGVWRFFAERTGGATRWLAFAPLLLFGALPLVGNWRTASRAGEWATREWAHDVLNSIEPYGVLITAGDNDTFPLWYAQDVEGVRRDVTIAVTSLLNTDWYARGLKRRPIERYDAAAGPALYRGRQWTMPTRPVLNISNADLAAVPEYLDVREPLVFQQGAIRAVIDPRRLEFGVPLRSDLLVLQMIKDNIGVRPFYISRTTASYPAALGLESYSLVQGLVTKIADASVASSPDTVAVAGIGHVDVRRSLALWRDVYRAPDAIIRRGDWVDRPSAGIPALYTSTAILLGAVLEEQGKADDARRVRERGVDVAEAAHVLEWFSGPAPSAPPAAGSDAPQRTSVPVQPR
jgi:hypothetical protein